MKNILQRLFTNRLLAFEILLATFFIALLNLGSPIFVINVLNRYVSYGVDGTLFTLAGGMLIVIFMQHGFRITRVKMLAAITKTPDKEIPTRFLGKLIHAKSSVLETIQRSQFYEMLRHIQSVQAAYDPANVISVIDAPFSCLYLIAIFFLSPVLGWIALFGVVFVMTSGFYGVITTKKISGDLQSVSSAHRSLVASAINGSDTVRTFRAGTFLSNIWTNQIITNTHLRLKLSENKEASQTTTYTANTLISVILYSIGSYFVVQGDLTIGALIGANILSSRAYQTIAKLVQTTYLISQSNASEVALNRFLSIPSEPQTGTALKTYSGSISFRDMGFVFPGSPAPLFESFHLDLNPGEILVVTGKNATGKTTFAKLVTGILTPTRGDILIDGISIRQIALPWWREQLMYIPQEPTFLNATIKENITFLNPDIEDGKLNQILNMADLKHFLDRTPGGLNTTLSEGGKHLSLGIRRRIAIARAMVSDGSLLVFDEPMEGLDEGGAMAVQNLLNIMVEKKKTIIICSHETRSFTGKGYVLNLNRKPIPELLVQDKTSSKIPN